MHNLWTHCQKIWISRIARVVTIHNTNFGRDTKHHDSGLKIMFNYLIPGGEIVCVCGGVGYPTSAFCGVQALSSEASGAGVCWRQNIGRDGP